MANRIGSIWACCVLCSSLGAAMAEDGSAGVDYEFASAGTRQFEWDTKTGPASIKILVEASNLGSEGAEVGEIFFPPEYESRSHFHELEILYIIEGELEHIVDGLSHVLKPGMVGIVRYPQQVIHKTRSPKGARVLVIWPLGNEVKGLQGMTEKAVQ